VTLSWQCSAADKLLKVRGRLESRHEGGLVLAGVALLMGASPVTVGGGAYAVPPDIITVGEGEGILLHTFAAPQTSLLGLSVRDS